MLNLSIELPPQTEQKIKRILDQYADKELFFLDIIHHKVRELKNGINNIEIDLRKFEKKYNLSSKDFYADFLNGAMEDSEDFITWSGVYEMQIENKRKLAELL